MAKEKLWSSTFVLLIIITLISSMNGNGLNNGISLLVEAAGSPTSLTGIIIGVFSLSALCGRVFCGHLSDSIGRMKVIAAGAVLMGLGCLISIIFSSVYAMIPCRIIMGVGFAMISTTTAAAVADVMPKSRIGEGVGLQGLAHALAMALGPSLGILFALNGGRLALFGGFFAMAVLALALTFLCKFAPQPKEAPDKLKDGASGGRSIVSRLFFTYIERGALTSMLIVTVLNLSASIYGGYISLYAVTNGIAGASLFFTISAAVMIVIRLLLSRYFDTIHVNVFLIPSFICGMLGFLCLLFMKSQAGLIAAGVFNGVFSGLTIPLIVAEGIKRSPDTRRGAASATVYIGTDIGVGLGSLIWGGVIDFAGFDAIFIGGIVFLIVDCVFALVLYAKPSGEKTADSGR